MTVTLQIALPDDVYRVLAAQADRCDTQVHKLVVAALTTSVRGKQLKTPTSKPRLSKADAAARDRRVKHLHGKGWSDNKIGEDIGVTGRHVGDIRRRLGLPKRFAKFGEVIAQ